MTDSQLPEWWFDLNMKDRNKIVKLCDRSVLCIASETRGPLTVDEVVNALGLRRVVVLCDETTGHYWIRGPNNESGSLRRRIRDGGLPGFTTRQIDRYGEEWERLAGKIADSMGLRNSSGPSQHHSSVEQQQHAPSTSHSSQLPFNENLGPGNGGASTSSLGLGGSETVSGSGSSGSSGPCILGGGGSAHASTSSAPDKRPRKKRRRDHKVSQQARVSSPTANPTHEESAPSLDLVGVPPPATSSTHEESEPPLDTAGVPHPATSSTHGESAPPLDPVGVLPPATSSTHEQSTPTLDPVSVPPPATSATHEHSVQPLDPVGAPPPATSSTPARRSLLLDIFLKKLSPELIADIFERCLEDAVSFEEYNSILETLACYGGRCFQVLEEHSSLWTKITSLSSKTHVEMALRLSQQRPLHIEGGPSGSRTVAANFEHLSHLIIHAEPHRDRWASLSLLFPSSMMKKVQWCLASPAPGLQMLSLFMANTADNAFPVGATAPTVDIQRSLSILGGEAGNLQRVFLNNVPCLWDPSPFTQIRELGLTNAIQLRFMETINFLRRSSNLSALRLVNINFVGDLPHVVEETILLPCLKELVFVELIERTGLGLLWLSLDTPACSRLELNLRPSEEMVDHPALPSRAAPTVQKALASTDNSLLRFQCNIDTNTQSAIWRSEDVDRPGQGEPRASFDIAFRGLGNGLAGFVCDFVRGVRERVGDVGGIVVNVAESFSGAFDQPLGVELEDLVPSLFPSSFRGLNVVEIRADVVHDHLRLLLEMMVPPEPQVWWLDALRTIRLSAIPKDELDAIPHETIQHSLKDFIQRISKHHYGIVLGLDEPKPPGKRSLSVVLQGVFDMSTRMNQALKEGKKVWGVTIKRTDVFLADGEVQEKGSGEEVQEADGETDVSGSAD